MITHPLCKAIIGSTLLVCTLATSSISVAASGMQVTGVEVYDALNLRSGPGISESIIGNIPPNGKQIELTGQQIQLRSSGWVEVTWNGQVGWVNSRYLTPSSIPATSNKMGHHNTHKNRGNPSSAQTQMAAGSHIHPSNECTNTITHTHPNSSHAHAHNYNCDPNKSRRSVMSKTNVTPQLPMATPMHSNAANNHTHPRNECTNTITHSHPNGKGTHKHHYACQPGQRAMKQSNIRMNPMMGPKQNGHSNGSQVSHDPDAHTHPANAFTRSRTHTHPNGAGEHTHLYINQQL